ncbi:MAG: hypothetical protein IKY98_05895 [Alphaproteobacteria bacterium]|nr:hypothetical protein [Alphaproteobacteria bacterium]
MYKILLLTCGILIVSFVARANDCAKGAVPLSQETMEQHIVKVKII